jgi:hypothetical protein
VSSLPRDEEEEEVMAKAIFYGGKPISELQLYCTRFDNSGSFVSGKNCMALTRGKTAPCSHAAYGKQRCWTWVHMEKGRTAPRYRRHK